ncbi:maleylpyruvate isomerase N-terminal domain-containing protein [Streptomyces sp. NPDC046197]|uniref:maleylpyruvate isomerase N-terminal domain-containing protein n=1 Tax=Streptomyces sp. NPDC046197 TaxID=3154337 RepID=UPI0033EC791D
MITDNTTDPAPADALRASYRALMDLVAPLEEEDSWLPTDCTGWAVRDLVFHLVMDAQRALVALHTPATAPADRDAVTYWQDWRPDPVGAANGRRYSRVGASMFLYFRQLRELCLDTAAAAVTAAASADPRQRVSTQGHVLAAGDLMATLAVEATVHHLDLTVRLPGAPAPSSEGLATVRSTLDGLLGRPVPLNWSDTQYARAGTGRLPLTRAERDALGADADRLPLFC